MQGARQVGKSTSVRMFAKENNLNLFEVNLEKYSELDHVFATLKIDNILRQIEGVLKRPLPEDSSSLLFLDEIQATPHALAALRYFYEETPNLPVIAAGSLLDFVLADHEFSMPVGRIEYLQVFPMSFDEFLLAREEHWLREQLITYKIGSTWPIATHDQLSLLLRDYMITGGMPEVVAQRIKNSKSLKWQQIQENIIQTFQDDFAKYAKKHRVGVLRQIFDRLPQQIGRKVKYSYLAPNERAEHVRDSILLLDKARILLRTFHTDASGIPLKAQKDENTFKCFMLDVGLYNLDLAKN